MTNVELLQAAIESETNYNNWITSQFATIINAISELTKSIEDVKSLIAPSEPDTDRLFSLKESAKYLQVSVPSLRNYVSKGLIATTQLSKGCNLRFKKSDLDNYLSATRKKTKSEITEIANNLLGAN